jgi:hypothetical protein
MTTLEEPRPLAAANLLLVAIVFLVLGVALIVSVSRKKTWRLPLARAQFDSPAIKSSVSKAPIPIRLAFIALMFTFLGLCLLAAFAPNYLPSMPVWFVEWGMILMQATLLLASCLIRKRDPELARCGFTVVIATFLGVLLAPA